MDSVDIVHGHCPAGVLERESIDNVHSVHGQCPLCPWTMSTQSMDGQFPLRPWTMSTESMDNVHSVPGLFPWVFPTLYLVQNYSNPTKLNAYIQFTMHAIYISWHTIPIMFINTDRHTFSLTGRSKNILHCFIYCTVVILFITFWKIITNWWSKCWCQIISSI